MNIRILLGTLIIVLINKLNGRFLLVNVGDPDVDDDDRQRIGDPDVDDDDRHKIGDPAVDDDYDRPRMGKIEIEEKCPACCPGCFHGSCANPKICPETARPKETLEKLKCPACCALGCEVEACGMPEICPQSPMPKSKCPSCCPICNLPCTGCQSSPNPISNQVNKGPNSTLPNSKSCPFACPNCCDDDACGAEEQKYCYECCPAPNKVQPLGLSCKPVNIPCLQNRDCCSGQCQGDGSMPYGKCAEKNDGKLKKEGEACGQSCNDDCGECEDGLTCAPAQTPTCRCGTCKRQIFS